tara:strand:- start:411 stop:794 length:384 start_codon:yes stop_codon:yes gene_type:complete
MKIANNKIFFFILVGFYLVLFVTIAVWLLALIHNLAFGPLIIQRVIGRFILIFSFSKIKNKIREPFSLPNIITPFFPRFPITMFYVNGMERSYGKQNNRCFVINSDKIDFVKNFTVLDSSSFNVPTF